MVDQANGINIIATSTGLPVWAIYLLLAWSFAWKATAMWKAARLSHLSWYIAIIVINTFGLFEMFYIFFIARKYTIETIEK